MGYSGFKLIGAVEAYKDYIESGNIKKDCVIFVAGRLSPDVIKIT